MIKRMLAAVGVVALLATACGGEDGDPRPHRETVGEVAAAASR